MMNNRTRGMKEIFALAALTMDKRPFLFALTIAATVTATLKLPFFAVIIWIVALFIWTVIVSRSIHKSVPLRVVIGQSFDDSLKVGAILSIKLFLFILIGFILIAWLSTGPLHQPQPVPKAQYSNEYFSSLFFVLSLYTILLATPLFASQVYMSLKHGVTEYGRRKSEIKKITVDNYPKNTKIVLVTILLVWLPFSAALKIFPSVITLAFGLSALNFVNIMWYWASVDMFDDAGESGAPNIDPSETGDSHQ